MSSRSPGLESDPALKTTSTINEMVINLVLKSMLREITLTEKSGSQKHV